MADYTNKTNYIKRTTNLYGITFNKRNKIDQDQFEIDVLKRMNSNELAKKYDIEYSLANKLKNAYIEQLFQNILESKLIK